MTQTQTRELETVVVINMLLVLLFLLIGERLLLISSFIFSFICLLSPKVVSYVHPFWSAIISFLGKVNATILLSFIFFIFLVPIALLRKLVSRKPSQGDSNYTIREHMYSPEDLERMG